MLSFASFPLSVCLIVFAGLLTAAIVIVSGAPPPLPSTANLPSQAFTLRCLDGSIEVDVQTNDDFKGVIYTEGSFRRNGCHIDAKGGTTFQLKFALNSCKTLDNGKGVYTNVIIVQNEDELVTLDDSSFEVKCDYNLKMTIRLEAQRPIQIEDTSSEPSAHAISDRRSTGTAVASIAKNNIYLSSKPIRNATLLTNGSSIATAA